MVAQNFEVEQISGQGGGGRSWRKNEKENQFYKKLTNEQKKKPLRFRWKSFQGTRAYARVSGFIRKLFKIISCSCLYSCLWGG